MRRRTLLLRKMIDSPTHNKEVGNRYESKAKLEKLFQEFLKHLYCLPSLIM